MRDEFVLRQKQLIAMVIETLIDLHGVRRGRKAHATAYALNTRNRCVITQAEDIEVLVRVTRFGQTVLYGRGRRRVALQGVVDSVHLFAELHQYEQGLQSSAEIAT